VLVNEIEGAVTALFVVVVVVLLVLMPVVVVDGPTPLVQVAAAVAVG